jgi:membrane-bound metal-dependent hydrolase YbcI (DUF457 family)
MPLVLGHLAVGCLTNSAIDKPKTTTRKKLFILFLLANSPDIDIVISWVLTKSPWPYHRTFTHSILFAIIMAVLFANLSKFFKSFPKLGYKWCYMMVMSHILADYLLSPFKVAFLWPLRIQPGSLNGILDFVDKYETLAREAQVILICLLGYLLIKAFRAAVNYVYRFLLPA